MKTFAFVFPGQGSQSVGMLDAVADHPAVRDTLAEAADALHEDVAALIAHGPAEALNLTANTQPVMLTAGVALWRLWLAEGGAQPARMAGHSLGEYTALVAAEALDFADALPLEKLVVTVDQHGNTSAASIPLALDAAVRGGKVKKGDTLMLEGVGGGFTWGAVLLDF